MKEVKANSNHPEKDTKGMAKDWAWAKLLFAAYCAGVIEGGALRKWSCQEEGEEEESSSKNDFLVAISYGAAAVPLSVLGASPGRVFWQYKLEKQLDAIKEKSSQVAESTKLQSQSQTIQEIQIESKESKITHGSDMDIKTIDSEDTIPNPTTTVLPTTKRRVRAPATLKANTANLARSSAKVVQKKRRGRSIKEVTTALLQQQKQPTLQDQQQQQKQNSVPQKMTMIRQGGKAVRQMNQIVFAEHDHNQSPQQQQTPTQAEQPTPVIPAPVVRVFQRPSIQSLIHLSSHLEHGAVASHPHKFLFTAEVLRRARLALVFASVCLGYSCYYAKISPSTKTTSTSTSTSTLPTRVSPVAIRIVSHPHESSSTHDTDTLYIKPIDMDPNSHSELVELPSLTRQKLLFEANLASPLVETLEHRHASWWNLMKFKSMQTTSPSSPKLSSTQFQLTALALTQSQQLANTQLIKVAICDTPIPDTIIIDNLQLVEHALVQILDKLKSDLFKCPSTPQTPSRSLPPPRYLIPTTLHEFELIGQIVRTRLWPNTNTSTTTATNTRLSIELESDSSAAHEWMHRFCNDRGYGYTRVSNKAAITIIFGSTDNETCLRLLSRTRHHQRENIHQPTIVIWNKQPPAWLNDKSFSNLTHVCLDQLHQSAFQQTREQIANLVEDA